MRTLFFAVAAAALIACAPTYQGTAAGGSEPTADGDHAFPSMAPGADLARWEHLCVADLSAQGLTDAGATGWELVSAVAHVHTELDGYANSTLIYCFKRAIPSVAPASAGEG